MYIGPGAGFAFIGSFLTLLGSLFLTVGSFLSWPFRMLWMVARGRRGYRNAKVKKLVFLGLDGFDPGLAERFMAEGKLPNFSRLASEGSYRRLRTTFPALSPVAWSTFATGVNPAKHNIFDFLNRDLRSYAPQLSSSRVAPPPRSFRIGRWTIPLSRPIVELRRKSTPFWKILGEHAIGSTILRVPITFPPDDFNGRLLSAMSTPDLKGTQGSFSLFSTKIEEFTGEGGSRYPLRRNGDALVGDLEGPDKRTVSFRIFNGQLEIGEAKLSLAAWRIHSLDSNIFRLYLRYRKIPVDRVRRGDFSVRHARSNRSRASGLADQPASLLRSVSIEIARPLRDAWDGGRHLGFE